MSKITGKEYPICDIFTSKFEYHIPSYQRPYAWEKEQAETLFDDLLDFYKNQPIDDNYFLAEVPRSIDYKKQRAREYPHLKEQMDMLWHLMDDGLLGDSVKQSSFYTTLKGVKDAYPKK